MLDGTDPGGVNVLSGDRGVEFIKNSIHWRMWRSVGTVGGEVISPDAPRPFR